MAKAKNNINKGGWVEIDGQVYLSPNGEIFRNMAKVIKLGARVIDRVIHDQTVNQSERPDLEMMMVTGDYLRAVDEGTMLSFAAFGDPEARDWRETVAEMEKAVAKEREKHK